MDQSGMNEQCGIFGIYNHPTAAEITYFGLYALQHRGQESCGIAVSERASRSPCTRQWGS